MTSAGSVMKSAFIAMLLVLVPNLLLAASADIEITNVNDDPNPVYYGNSLTYSIYVHNHGPDDAENVLVTDTLPDGVSLVSADASQGNCSGTTPVICDIGTIIKGGQARIDILATHNATCTLLNTASVTSVSDPYLGNNSWTSVTAVEGPLCANADLSVRVTDYSEPTGEDNTTKITYTITIENSGPDVATDVILQDSTEGATIFDLVSVTSTRGNCFYPTCSGMECFFIDSEPQRVTCEIDYLSPETSEEVSVVINVLNDTYTNTASLTSGVFDPDYTNNSDTKSTTVSNDSETSGDDDGGDGGGGGGCFIVTPASSLGW